MTDEEEHTRRALAKEVAQETIMEMFELCGMNVRTEKGREEMRKLLSWLRAVEHISTRTGTTMLLTIVTVIMSGVLYAAWHGIEAAIRFYAHH